MSAWYEFRKVYADLVTDGGQVCVLYLNYVKTAGVWTSRASVEWYEADGGRTLLHGRGSPPLVDEATPLSDLPLRVPVDGGTFALTLREELGAWRPPEASPVQALSWSVRAARTRATATFGERTWRGTGYVDLVRIRRPTRLLGLGELRWGRVHLPGRTVVVEQLTAGDARWDTGVDWALGEGPAPLAGLLELAPDGTGRVPLRDGDLALRPLRVLHSGNAFDPERVPRRVDRLACEVIGGPTRETRWLGAARLGGEEGLALYESVRFG